MDNIGVTIPTTEEFDPSIPEILPHDKVYLIQVGYKLFRLSGASLSLDGPSYFTNFFSQPLNEDKVLFIDRNPVIFEKIYNHLQGYHIKIDHDFEFMHLWQDCFYFGLKRLQALLNDEDIFATIGGQLFKINRNLLKHTGNHPSFFSINFDSVLTDNLRVIERKNMLRPPNQRPATVANRLPLLFLDLLEILRGNPLVIRDDEHRSLLIREARYYRFLELEQRIIKHAILKNPFMARQEIVLHLNDIQAKSVTNEPPAAYNGEYPILYARPHILREPKRVLVVQIDAEVERDGTSEVKLIINRHANVSFVKLTNKVRSKFVQTFKHLSGEFAEHDSEETFMMLAGLRDAKVVFNGMQMKDGWIDDFMVPGDQESEPPSKKRKATEDNGPQSLVEFRLTKSLWRLMAVQGHVRLHAVLLEGTTSVSEYNRQHAQFL